MVGDFQNHLSPVRWAEMDRVFSDRLGHLAALRVRLAAWEEGFGYLQPELARLRIGTHVLYYDTPRVKVYLGGTVVY